MTPVEFHINPSGIIHVMAGVNLIGIIEPRTSRDGMDASYTMLMPMDGAIEKPNPAPSIKVARRRLLHRLAAWCDSSGWQNLAEALAAQAEMEGDVV